MSLLIMLMLIKRKDIFWYPCPLYPISTEGSRKRRSCLFISYTDTYSSFKKKLKDQKIWKRFRKIDLTVKKTFWLQKARCFWAQTNDLLRSVVPVAEQTDLPAMRSEIKKAGRPICIFLLTKSKQTKIHRRFYKNMQKCVCTQIQEHSLQ